MQLSIAEQSKQDIVTLLFGQSLRLSLSHPIAAILMVSWFSLFAPTEELLVWFSAILLISVLRPILNNAFNKYRNKHNTHLWLYAWVGLSAILASVYSLGFIHFVPIDSPVHIMSVGLFICALSGASIIVYGASRVSMLGFFLPLTLPSIIYFSLYAGNAGLMLGASLLFYSVVVLSTQKTISEAFKKSIILHYQHQQEREKRKLVEKQLQDVSRRDSLTGLFNRRYFDEILDTEMGRAHRNHSTLCLIMFEVDYFTQYTDHYGHVAGDNCLIAVAEIVEGLTSRKGDLIARYGGEEFAIILPAIEIEGAIAFANKVQQTIQAKRIEHKTTKLSSLNCVTVSVGVTNLIPFKRIKVKDFIDTADSALYEAKRQGRNRVHCIENNGFSQNFI